jgi:general secretion pathway protein G
MNGDSARRKAGGFTLIEVLLVVAILGMLAAVVVVNLVGKGDDARRETARMSVAGICGALDIYEVNVGKFPASLDGLITDDGSPNWKGPYLKVKTLPVDPWGTPFAYSAGDRTYEVRCAGPDKQMNSQDDLTN